MGLFNATVPLTVGVLVDIGSASVLVAIVVSDTKKTYPDIVWSYREHVTAREGVSAEQSSKQLLSALFNASLQLDTVGRKVLAQSFPKAPSPSYVQTTVTAPFAHTITKTVSYSEDGPFKITDSVLADLEVAAQKKVEEAIKESSEAATLGLSVFMSGTTEVLANGYAVQDVTGQQASGVALTRVNALVPQTFVEALNDIQEKTFSIATDTHFSFMVAYFYVTKALYPEMMEYCLIDVTFEAIEIGIVRDGVLRYCSHIPRGAYTLARELASLRQVPLAEAYGLMQSGLVTDANETTKQAAATQEMLVAFETAVAALFLETGDSLSIPKTLFVHSTLNTEVFFMERLKNAATMATRSIHRVVGVSKELLTRYYPSEVTPQLVARHDTGVLVTAQFFHTERERKEFE